MALNVVRQLVTEKYAVYCGDSCKVMKGIPDDSIGFSVFSPPFVDLFCYSEDSEDMGNCSKVDEFFDHFGYVISELYRTMMPGRIVAVHCADLPIRKQDQGYIAQYDFPGDIVRNFLSRGFVYHGRVCIWKDPLVMFMRTKLHGLAHKQVCKDSSEVRNGNADYVITFRKRGENPKPITHQFGLTEYHGQRKVPKELDRWIDWKGHQRENRRSQWIWQQYASPVWFDIRQMTVLPYTDAKESEDERHVCPLQLDVIERCMALWSAKGDTFLTPFMGVGSEVYVAVKNGLKGVGIELKESYFRQAVRNIRSLEKREEEPEGISI